MRVIVVPRRMPMAKLIRLLAAAGVEEALLKVPRGARGFKVDVDLELLALYSREHNLHLILSTSDKELRGRAAWARLQAVPDLPAVSAAEAAAGREKPLGGPMASQVALLALAASLIVLSATFLLWPRTSVYVAGTKKRLTMTVEAGLSAAYHESQISQGLLPVRVLNHAGLIVAEISASGEKNEGVTPARGILTWLNDSKDSLVVPAGTQVRSKDGRCFKTMAALTVPAAKRRFLLGIRISETSGQADGEILAVAPGTSGNLGPGNITEIIGPLVQYLRVLNQAALSGGTDRKVTVVTREDLDRAGTEARRQAELQAPDELSSLAGSDYIMLPETTAITYGRPTGQPQAGMAGKRARCSLPYSARCLAPSRAVLAAYLSLKARQNVPAHFEAMTDSFDVQALHASPRRPEEADLRIVSTYTAAGRLDRGRIVAAIRGKTVAEARQALLAMPEVASVEINPPRGGRLPRLAWLIRVVIPKRDGS